jgi:hypothetical protein
MSSATIRVNVPVRLTIDVHDYNRAYQFGSLNDAREDARNYVRETLAALVEAEFNGMDGVINIEVGNRD